MGESNMVNVNPNLLMDHLYISNLNTPVERQNLSLEFKKKQESKQEMVFTWNNNIDTSEKT